MLGGCDAETGKLKFAGVRGELLGFGEFMLEMQVETAGLVAGSLPLALASEPERE